MEVNSIITARSDLIQCNAKHCLSPWWHSGQLQKSKVSSKSGLFDFHSQRYCFPSCTSRITNPSFKPLSRHWVNCTFFPQCCLQVWFFHLSSFTYVLQISHSSIRIHAYETQNMFISTHWSILQSNMSLSWLHHGGCLLVCLQYRTLKLRLAKLPAIVRQKTEFHIALYYTMWWKGNRRDNYYNLIKFWVISILQTVKLLI